MPKNTKINAFAEQRKDLVKIMLDIFDYKNDIRIVFNRDILDDEINTRMKILYVSYKRYFYTSGIQDNPDDRNYLLSMFKNVLKEMNYKVYTTEKKIKFDGKYKTTIVYNIIPPFNPYLILYKEMQISIFII